MRAVNAMGTFLATLVMVNGVHSIPVSDALAGNVEPQTDWLSHGPSEAHIPCTYEGQTGCVEKREPKGPKHPSSFSSSSSSSNSKGKPSTNHRTTIGRLPSVKTPPSAAPAPAAALLGVKKRQFNLNLTESPFALEPSEHKVHGDEANDFAYFECGNSKPGDCGRRKRRSSKDVERGVEMVAPGEKRQDVDESQIIAEVKANPNVLGEDDGQWSFTDDLPDECGGEPTVVCGKKRSSLVGE